MDGNFKKIENFYDPDPVLSSVDLIAVKAGIKKTARIQWDGSDFKKIETNLRRHGLYCARSAEKLLGRHDVYVAAYKKWAAAAKKADPSYKIINEGKTFNEAVGYVREFSRLLSYPECCVEEYIANNLNGSQGVSDLPVFKKIPERMDFAMNNILHGASNYFLSFHLPCSFFCRRTLEYQKNIFKAVAAESPGLAQKIKYYLARPFLVFLDLSPGSPCVSWDNRRGFVFDGRINAGVLRYSSAVEFRANYPDYAHVRDDKFALLRSKIAAGNRIVWNGKGGFKIFKGGKLLQRFESKNILSVFFNFSAEDKPEA